jgi:outer membrane protein TolC
MARFLSRFGAAALLFASVAARAQEGPHPPAPTVPPPPSVDDPMLQPVAAPSLVMSSWSETLERVRANSVDLRRAYADVMRAEAQSQVARAGVLPSLTANGAVTHNFITNEITAYVGTTPQTYYYPPYNLVTANVTAVQPLVAPRAWYAMGTAQAVSEVARLSLVDMKRKILASVAGTIVGVVAAERIAELNREGLRTALERLELTRRQQTLGSASTLDTMHALQDKEIARASIVSSNEAVRRAREALGIAIGVPQQVGVSPEFDLNGLETSVRAVCRSVATSEERADLVGARTRAVVAQRKVTDARYQYIPTLTAESTLAWTSFPLAAPNDVEHPSAPHHTHLGRRRARRSASGGPGGRDGSGRSARGAPSVRFAGARAGTASCHGRGGRSRRRGGIAENGRRDRAPFAPGLCARRVDRAGARNIRGFAPSGRDHACPPGVRTRSSARYGVARTDQLRVLRRISPGSTPPDRPRRSGAPKRIRDRQSRGANSRERRAASR